MSGHVRIGTSGFTYDHWKDVFYPPDVPTRAWLEFYAERSDTVEINTSYYHMPRPNVCASWRERSPQAFCFVMKLYGGITHRRRLENCEGLLVNYLDAVGRLEEKLGPILVQLPPRFTADPARLDAFLRTGPPDRRWAVEFRHPSWLCDEVYAVLREHRAALVVHDLLRDHPDVVTAGWAYLRFHGAGEQYGGSYTDAMLRAAARRIREHVAQGRDVYAYFNNDAHGHAVKNALRLKEIVAARPAAHRQRRR